MSVFVGVGYVSSRLIVCLLTERLLGLLDELLHLSFHRIELALLTIEISAECGFAFVADVSAGHRSGGLDVLVGESGVFVACDSEYAIGGRDEDSGELTINDGGRSSEIVFITEEVESVGAFVCFKD